MARYIGPVCRLCRREGAKLFLKGDKCSSPNCTFNKKTAPPGMHGQSRKKVSEYGIQLREKQKAKRIYGVLETQFRNYFKKATQIPGVSGENLLIMLEMRLDSVVYSLGYGRSRTEARQVVRHNHITVNGKKVNIPSYQVHAGDIIEIKTNSKELDRFDLVLESTGGRIVPEWLSADHENFKGTVLSAPSREQITVPVQETLIVELYSK